MSTENEKTFWNTRAWTREHVDAVWAAKTGRPLTPFSQSVLQEVRKALAADMMNASRAESAVGNQLALLNSFNLNRKR
jgi:hypothetical protein